MRESKEERFHRVAEARTNKAISMIRLLGNCSNSMVYVSRPDQVEQIFAALQTELDRARKRFVNSAGRRKRFSLSEEPEPETTTEPSIQISLPDGTALRAVAYQQDDYPAINIYWDSRRDESPELICFAEYNPERSPCHELCAAAYQADKEDTTYYKPYVPEGGDQA